MARYGGTITSLNNVTTNGVNATTTLNGWFGYWGASATAGFRLRRLKVGVRVVGGGVPTSQQYSLAVYRQSVAPSGTGLNAAVLGQPFETWTLQTDPTVGLITPSAASVGTTGPTLGANPIDTVTLNTQSYGDVPWEFMEEMICPLGTANGFALVNIGSTLPGNHIFVVSFEIEV